MSRIFPRGKEGNAPPEYGKFSNPFRSITLNLGAARDNEIFYIGGSVLWAQSATSAAAEIQVRYNDETNEKLSISRGFFLSGYRFSRLFVSNDAQAGETITLLYLAEDTLGINVENPGVIMNDVNVLSGPGIITGLSGVTDLGLGVGGITEFIIPANPKRYRLEYGAAYRSGAGSQCLTYLASPSGDYAAQAYVEIDYDTDGTKRFELFTTGAIKFNSFKSTNYVLTYVEELYT